MTEPEPKRFTFDLSGGHLALDFANTVSWRGSAAIERLTSYADLVRWSEQSGALPRSRTTGLLVMAMRDPQKAAAILERAIRLREALFAIFAAVAANEEAPEQAMATLNTFLDQGSSYVRLKEKDRRFVWDWASKNPLPDAMLWPVARAAADLLASDELEKVRICAASDCAWLFLDKTRNHARRWCDMTTCGNRAKARRHYERIKARAQ